MLVHDTINAMSGPETNLHEILNVATNAARHAGQIIVDGQRDALSSVKHKGSIVDVVTSVDHETERLIVETILESYPDDGIVAEEGSSRPSQTGRRWIIDPLDGTANFVRRWSMSVVSIGVEIDDAFTVGVIYNPFTNEMFHGVTGHGAWLNGERLLPSDDIVLFEGAHVGVEGGYMTWARDQRVQVVGGLIAESGAIRSCGSTALMLAYVAAERLDAHVNIGSSVWDIAAATVIAREAGCVVEGLEGGSEPTAHHTIAGRPELIEPLRKLVREAADKYETGMTPTEDAHSQQDSDVPG
jgi:myo-inositol-1(or 4)-monophosphatase